MFESKIKSRYRINVGCKNSRIYQGDILKNLSFATKESDNDSLQNIFLNFAVILNQDCDIEQDFKYRGSETSNQDKYLLSILICPAFNLDIFAKGEHLKGWEQNPYWKTNNLTSGDIIKLKKNSEFKRFHFLPAERSLSIPELVIDFKHFFALPRNLIYSEKEDKYLASLSELFREELSQRFANYLSRIGLPEIQTAE